MAASDRINYTVVRDKSEGSFTTRAKVDKGNIVNNDHMVNQCKISKTICNAIQLPSQLSVP